MTVELVPIAPRELPDTTEDAVATSPKEMPWEELRLKADEYEWTAEILDRRPTNAELAMYPVMWPECCSYKSSKKHLIEQFGKRTSEEMKHHLLVGMGQNAGAVDIGGGWVVTFKVESHNHPSFAGSYQRAAIGVGGIVRDIISTGARPVAVMDQLRFGSVDHPDTAHVVHGVVSGVGGYGDCLDPPNVGGETEFDPSYQGSPFANALCVGTLRHEDIHLANATGEGNLVVPFGARTGDDDIDGASILASETFEDGMLVKHPSVQVGDPFMEKVLIECYPDLSKAGVAQGIQDLGVAGISCATLEFTSSDDSGMHVDLEKVFLHDPSLTAGEILIPESQERMMAIVISKDGEHLFEIIDKWDVGASIIGELTGDGRLAIDHLGHRIVDMDPKTVVHEGPVYDRPYVRPLWQDELQANTSAALARLSSSEELITDTASVPTDVNQASKAWMTDQYDRYVQDNTAPVQSDDAGAIHVDEESGLGVALVTDVNGWYAKPDPTTGVKQTLAKSHRNVMIVGAEPVAIADCLNFGNPGGTDAMWQPATAMTVLTDGCIEPDIPVTGGNMSLYNFSGTEKNLPNSSINPTPVVGMLGIMEDVSRTDPSSFMEEGLAAVPPDDARSELDGSAWARIRHGHLGDLPPQVDLSTEVVLGNVACVLSAIDDPQGRPLIRAAHDLSNGGLTQSLVDTCLCFGVGGSFNPSEAAGISGLGDFEVLFSEFQRRALIAVHEAALPAVYATAGAEGARATRIGMSGGKLFAVLDMDLLGEGEKPWIADPGEPRAASEATLRDRF